MGITISYGTGDGGEAMLALSVPPETTVGEVARQLHRADPARRGAPIPDGLTLAVTPRSAGRDVAARVADPEADFASSGVRSGDHVVIAAVGADAPAPDVVATAHVVAGPDAGAAFELAPGSSIIGRDYEAHVRLSDLLASKRHARITVGDQIEVADMGSTNGVMLGDAYVTRALVLPGDRIVIGDTEIEIRRVEARTVDAPTTHAVSLTRSPRVVPPVPSAEVDLPQPPARPRPRRLPALAMLAPVMLGLTMFLATHRVLTLLFVAMSPLMMLGNWWDSHRVARRELREKSLEFDEDLRSACREVAQLQAHEREARWMHSPRTSDVVSAIRSHGALMWTRRPEHDDFLSVCLGVGALPSAITAALPSRGESYPGFWERLLEARDELRLVDGVPVADNLRSCGSLGIAGAPDRARALTRALAIQLAGLHSPAELVLAALTSSTATAQWQWMGWLPHTSSASSPVEGDHLADTRGGAARLLTALEQVVAQRAGVDIADVEPSPRRDLASDEPSAPSRVPAIVVLVEDGAVADRNRLIRLAETGPDVNVHVMWIAASVDRLPAACRTFIALDEGGGTGGFVRRGLVSAPLLCDSLTLDEVKDLARLMACVEDAGAVVDAAEDIPRAVSYLDLHGYESIEPGIYAQRWKADPQHEKRPFTLRALVGAGGDGPCYLDLRSQGPHALVGGTTGAGKSEFLQSWILGMAAAYGPDRVTFLLVDYKGGSAFADCVNLPHSVGLVTDLTPQLVERALTSLRAELRFRERLLHDKRAKDLESLVRSGDPAAPPSLVIVIDEFAALVTEVPDFVDGVVDIAQRGRSLGLHLILATQRPAGVIKDNLRANTPLRIALRMADESDSADILGVRDAAHVDASLPGRALARTGPGRVLPFQAAYAGGHSSPAKEAPPIEVRELAMGTRAEWTPPASTAATAAIGPTDAARAVAAMRAAMEELELPLPRRPWLDELSPVYDLAALCAEARSHIVVGLVDDPARQRQAPAVFDPDAEGNVVFYGSSGSGRSTALRTVALGATLAQDGGPVHIYGIDAASGGLDPLRPLPHVGAILDVEDAERVGRLMRRLVAMVDERAARYGAVHASHVTEYRAAAGAPEEPRVLLLIDGYGAFQSEYMNEVGRHETFAHFAKVLSEGRSVGIHVVLTADRAGAIHSSIQAQLSRVMALRLNDDNQYALMGLKRSAMAQDAPPGRAVDVARGSEMQVAVLGASPSIAVQAREIAALAESLSGRQEWVAPDVRAMPTVVSEESLPRAVEGLPVLGVEELTLEPLGLRLDRPLLVAGQAGSGRTATLLWLSRAIARAHPNKRQVLLTMRRSQLAEEGHWVHAATSATEIEALIDVLRPFAQTYGDGDEQLVVVIEAVNDFIGSACEMALLTLVRELRRNGHAVVGEAESSAWAMGMVPAEFKSARRGLLLQPDGQDGVLVGAQLPRIARSSMPVGRGVFVENGRVRVVHIPLAARKLSTDPPPAQRAMAGAS